MKRILCYGDSNTYGHNPENGTRLSFDQRWPGILAGLLGSDWQVIEEGLCGRTIAMEDPAGYGLSGMAYLEPCLLSHFPLDMVVIMLGTNDLQTIYSACSVTIALSFRSLICKAKEVISSHGENTKILIVSPIHIGDTRVNDEFRALFPTGKADVYSRLFAPIYSQIAKLEGCLFLNAASVAEPSPLDGLHMDPSNHASLAEAIADMIHMAEQDWKDKDLTNHRQPVNPANQERSDAYENDHCR